MRPFVILSLILGAVPMARAADLDKLLEKREFGSGKSVLPYRLMKPEGYDGSKDYPLVVFLHGAGERGKDNKAQLKHGVKDFASDAARKKHPCFLIAPQCPSGQSWAAFRGGFAKAPTTPAKQVLALIAELRKEFKIDPKRIYLTGLSMGGYGTWDLLAREPGLFAAGLPVCGGGDPATAEKIAKIPLWVFHGDKDTAVPVERSRTMVEAVKKAGGEPKYTEYKGVGHDSWTATYKDAKVRDWLFAQKK
jgi:predicted peptidase